MIVRPKQVSDIFKAATPACRKKKPRTGQLGQTEIRILSLDDVLSSHIYHKWRMTSLPKYSDHFDHLF